MTTLPYNHLDAIDRQRPLPLAIGDLPPLDLRTISRPRTIFIMLPTVTGSPIRIRLDTDSDHLAAFFAMNWPRGERTHAADEAQIVALRNPATTYGIPSHYEAARWYSPVERRVLIVGSEYYGNLKITVRGLCSELASGDDMFIHGCALVVAGNGLILSGASGAGKTTLAAALRSARPGRVLVVNDDWGPFSLSSRESMFTGEPLLHMKYPSVRALAPSITLSPLRYPSENFKDDTNDPRARLLISRSEVFGSDGIVDRAPIRLFALVMRTPDAPPSVRALTIADVDLLASGRHAFFYDRVEHFMNGSLFLASHPQMNTQLLLHRRLLASVACVLVNNSGAPADVAALLLDALQSAPSVTR